MLAALVLSERLLAVLQYAIAHALQLVAACSLAALRTAVIGRSLRQNTARRRPRPSRWPLPCCRRSERPERPSEEHEEQPSPFLDEITK